MRARTSPRTMRAYQGHQTIPTARRGCGNDGPREATMAMARMGPGRARKRSVRRMSTVSTQPPVKPATRPINPPIRTPLAMTAMAENHEDRMP